MPRKAATETIVKKTKKTTETPIKTKKTTKPKADPPKTRVVVSRPKSVQKKDNEKAKEVRRQVKVLQNTMKSGKFTEDWDEVGDAYWLKILGDGEDVHFVIKASMDRKPVFTLFGLRCACEYMTIFDTVSLEKDTDERITIKFTNKLGEYRHHFSF